MTDAKVHLEGGYGYKLEYGSASLSWRTAPNDEWELVIIPAGPAEVLGRREIDGADCIVAKRGRGRGEQIYAQSAAHVTLSKRKP